MDAGTIVKRYIDANDLYLLSEFVFENSDLHEIQDDIIRHACLAPGDDTNVFDILHEFLPGLEPLIYLDTGGVSIERIEMIDHCYKQGKTNKGYYLCMFFRYVYPVDHFLSCLFENPDVLLKMLQIIKGFPEEKSLREPFLQEPLTKLFTECCHVIHNYQEIENECYGWEEIDDPGCCLEYCKNIQRILMDHCTVLNTTDVFKKLVDFDDVEQIRRLYELTGFKNVRINFKYVFEECDVSIVRFLIDNCPEKINITKSTALIAISRFPLEIVLHLQSIISLGGDEVFECATHNPDLSVMVHVMEKYPEIDHFRLYTFYRLKIRDVKYLDNFLNNKIPAIHRNESISPASYALKKRFHVTALKDLHIHTPLHNSLLKMIESKR